MENNFVTLRLAPLAQRIFGERSRTNTLNQSGQIILILLLVMTIALGVGLSIVQRSLTDISTSTKVEQSSRAFSAAEAGIEKAIKGDLSPVSFPDAQSAAATSVSVPEFNQALEFPPLGKEEIAHFWLADLYDSTNNPPDPYYLGGAIDLYWGTPGLPASDQAAIEVNVVHLLSGVYQTKKFYFDPNDTRNDKNGFTPVTCSNHTITTSFGPNRNFFCKVTLDFTTPPALGTRMIIRTRFLYTGVSQPVALQPLGGCEKDCSLPKQAKIYSAIGTSGETQRTIQLFTLDKVVPFYFDYAIFSAGPIEK